jgi:hypothetical protein
MDQEGREGQVLTGRLMLPQQPLGIRDAISTRPWMMFFRLVAVSRSV